jgi:hypothetical protein
MSSLRRGLLFAAVLLLLGGLPFELRAQGVTERERQEALLPDRGVLEIGVDLRNRLSLFPEVTGFRWARLFLAADGTAILEIESLQDGRLVRERRRLGDAELTRFRDDLAGRLDTAGRSALAPREGRGGLVLGHTLLGVGFHGWAVPVALDVNSPQGAVAAYLLTAGASFYLPYRLTRGRPVTETHRGLSLYGGTRGILAGLLVGDMVAGDDPDGSRSGRAMLGGGVLAGAAGGTLGYMAVERWGPTRGSADLWGAFMDGGFLAGAAVAYLAGPYGLEEVERRDGDLVWIEERTRNRAVGHGLTLLGGVAGGGIGGWLSGRRAYTPGDVAALRSAAVLGVQTGFTTARLLGAEDDGEPYVAAMLAGGVASAWATDRWATPRGLDRGEGLLVNAGHLAGTATAAGITYLLVDAIDGNETALLLASTAGGILGAGLVWRAVADGPRRPDRSAALPTVPATGVGSRASQAGVSVQLHPVGILEGFRPAGSADRGVLQPTWLTIRF